MTPPVILIVFNRPDPVRRVLEAIRAAKPSKLLIVADGPRADRPGEPESCAATRAVVDAIDWECEVLRDFSDVNLGCKNRVASGLAWAFGQVDQAIILEDDCVPSRSFFRFCGEMLKRYADDERVMMVSGDNRTWGARNPGYSYYFSRYPNIWGWATWRRAWAYYDISMREWPRLRDEKRFDAYFKKASERYYWKSMFDYVYRGFLDTWDYQWVYSVFKESGLCVAPERNLVRNIGFEDNATHTTSRSIYAELEAEELEFPLRHPSSLLVDWRCDELERRIRVRNVGMLPYPLNRLKDWARDIVTGDADGR